MDDLKEVRQKAIIGNEHVYKCEICDKEFKKNNGLKRHVKVVHNFVKEHQCNICQKVFMLQTQLNSHVKIVHENKKYHKCKSCEKSFSHATLPSSSLKNARTTNIFILRNWSWQWYLSEDFYMY